MCLVMAESPSYFRYDELERLVYRIFDLIFRKTGRQRIPVPSLIDAFLIMFSELCEEMRLKDTNLGTILETAKWERHFTNLRNADDSSNAPSRQRSRSPRRGADDARGAKDQVNETLRIQKELQKRIAAQDREIASLKASNRKDSNDNNNNNNNGGGRNNGGKGDRKGQGKSARKFIRR